MKLGKGLIWQQTIKFINQAIDSGPWIVYIKLNLILIYFIIIMDQNLISQAKEVGSSDNPQHKQADQTLQQLNSIKDLCIHDHQIIKNSKYVYVGTGFTFNLTQFFVFSKKKQIQDGGILGSIFYEISGGGLSWIILAYSVFNASLITTWILSSQINKFLALTWRFIFQAFLMVPFILHEKRTIKEENSFKYQLLYILKIQNIKKIYLASVSATIWYFFILSASEWTYISHALYFGSLINFFVSLTRHSRSQVHEYELGGQVLVIFGLIITFIDTFYFHYEKITPEQIGSKNNFYLSHTKYQRLAADLIALFTSFLISRFSKNSLKIHTVYPPFLSMFLLDMANALNLLFIAYFFNGITFDFDHNFGFFSIFIDYEFAIFMYGGIVLCLGLIISFILVARLFPNFVAPSIAYFFEPGLSALFLNVTNVQALPRSLSLLGYTIMTPGMILISVGHWLFLRDQKRHQVLDNLRYIQLKQIHDKNRKAQNENVQERKIRIDRTSWRSDNKIENFI